MYFSYNFKSNLSKHSNHFSVNFCCVELERFLHVFCILGGEHALDVDMYYKTGQRGCKVLMVDNFSYNRNRKTDDKTYWICSRKVRFQLINAIGVIRSEFL